MAGLTKKLGSYGPTLTALCAIASSAVGCASSPGAQDGGLSARSLGQVQLTFTRDGRSDAQAHFARWSAADTERVVLLGMADDDAIPLDGCRLVDGADEIERALGGDTSSATIELLDAGRLQVRGPSSLTALSKRHYPELTPYVAGVVYGVDDATSVALEPGALYEIRGDGGEDVGAFAAQAVAPRAFPQLATSFHGGALDLRWAEAGEVSDPLLLTVGWSGRSGARELRCRVRDDGSFRVARELLPPPGTRAELTVTRSRRAPLVAVGVSRGEVSIALREIVPLVADQDGP